jgi:translocation protein SEC66
MLLMRQVWSCRSLHGLATRCHPTDFEQANAFAPNWGQTIFQSASEIAQNTHLRERLAEITSKTGSEKDWWEKKKAGIQSEFMKELDEEKEGVLVEKAGGIKGKN